MTTLLASVYFKDMPNDNERRSDRFRYLDHMTDSVIEAYGKNMEDAFENSALALVNTMFDINKIQIMKQEELSAHGHDMQSLLYDFLEKVIILISVEGFAAAAFKVVISENIGGDDIEGSYSLSAIAKGEAVDLNKHSYKVEVKAITYHEMSIVQEGDEVKIRFLIDL
jgi:SHS2 domain-containing protein